MTKIPRYKGTLRTCDWPGCTVQTECWLADGWASVSECPPVLPKGGYLCPKHSAEYEGLVDEATYDRSKWHDKHRFEIIKLGEGPWGRCKAEGLAETVEKYDDEFTARVRVAVLNHGLAKKKYTLLEQVDDGCWEEVEDLDDDAEAA